MYPGLDLCTCRSCATSHDVRVGFRLSRSCSGILEPTASYNGTHVHTFIRATSLPDTIVLLIRTAQLCFRKCDFSRYCRAQKPRVQVADSPAAGSRVAVSCELRAASLGGYYAAFGCLFRFVVLLLRFVFRRDQPRLINREPRTMNPATHDAHKGRKGRGSEHGARVARRWRGDRVLRRCRAFPPPAMTREIRGPNGSSRRRMRASSLSTST